MGTDFNVLDAVTGEEISTFETCPLSIFMDWHPHSQIIAILVENEVYVCDAFADEVVLKLNGGIGQKPEDVILGYLNALDWHPDGKRLASVAFDGTVRIWHVF